MLWSAKTRQWLPEVVDYLSGKGGKRLEISSRYQLSIFTPDKLKSCLFDQRNGTSINKRAYMVEENS